MCSTSHPFLDGLKNYPAGKKKDLQKIRSWIITQAHLPTISDEYIYLFLHACYYNQDRTKQAIETYFTLRTNTASIFGNRDVDSNKIKTCTEIAHIIRLPKDTPEGYKVLMYSVKDTDYTKLVFADAVKGFCMFNDCILSEDGLAEGYVVLFDMKGLALGHIARVSLPALKAFMVYIQEAHPARLKAVHVLNTANYINHIMRIVIPLIRSELISIVKFHKGNVPEGFPVEIMPKDYGGEAPSTTELDGHTLSLMTKYKQWLLDSETFRVDESRRVKKASWWSLLSGSNQTAQALEEQNKTLFQNLQID
ncbi:PREDICTED: alpha-tocopherol transfer protein-like [Nicrophorus vespilloides]|uniref:Alpha-tocopherol transfer protein-like n=1 Tax=Nicrophorus vespilloides TaxID=110193 RepID=A0ABM1MRR8_NICVS|nr:PREDICTED: alpha-tocopherol transfer protein-like [Nicrophorus vespilloides]